MTNLNVVSARITTLRLVMKQHGVAACLLPSSDPHLSEYLPAHWQGRQWFSGFTGSMGTLIVTDDFAGVWADSRYWQQAEKELAGTGIVLVKISSGASTQHVDWLAQNIKHGSTVAVDGAVLGLAAANELKTALGKAGVVLRTDIDLIAGAWPERPALPSAGVYEHCAPYASAPRAEKFSLLRAQMTASGTQWHWLSTLDDIAWLFNLRGADVSYNPVFLAHALIGRDSATLFVGAGKVDAALAARLKLENINVADYAQALPALAALPAGSSILIDPRRITFGTANAIAEGVERVEQINPTTLAKSQKNANEISHWRQAMEQDGAALCEFFAWLEGAMAAGETISEILIDEKIMAARARRPNFVCPSFGTIAGWNDNGAMPHYHATPESHAIIHGDGLLLIDSGGQYLGGTTDITRTVAVGNLLPQQRTDCTLVLKGMLQLAMAVFPVGTLGPTLDILARAPIWAANVNYGHGTGHGVGYFLNVHEGPQTISQQAQPAVTTAMLAGMVTSDEPGIYRPGQWGVRIENLLLTVPAATNEFGEFLRFETLTLCPIDVRCIDVSLLTAPELAAFNSYHAEVRRRLAPLVGGAALDWLNRATTPV
jgi:Xaa-Pro aminopeptidase